MNMLITAPSVTANEDEVVLTKWHADAGSAVKKGDPVCDMETTKATVEVEAECDGFLFILANAGDRVSVGAPIAALMEEADGDVDTLLNADAPAKLERRWTKKAEIVARKLGIDIETVTPGPNGNISEDDVRRAAETSNPEMAETAASAAPAISTGDLFDDAHPESRQERLLLLGGGAGAGAMAVDVLARIPHQRASVILDGNPDTHGKAVGGVPILGGLDLTDELYEQGAFDKAIILFTQDVDERADIFADMRSRNIPFGNLIDPTVAIRGGSRMGVGNLIMANCFFSTSVSVGDNCFFASHCVIEHHSTLGNHCAFGPRTTTSGAVQIGERVKTGMGVCIEPYVEIGAHSRIASGCVITGNIPAGSLVKAQQTHSVHAAKNQEYAA